MPSPDALLLRAVQALYDWLLDEFGLLVGHFRHVALVFSWAVWIGLALTTPECCDDAVIIAICAVIGWARCPEYLRTDTCLQRAGHHAALNSKAMRKTGFARGAGILVGLFLMILCCMPQEWTGLAALYGAWLTEAVLVRERRPSRTAGLIVRVLAQGSPNAA